MIKNISLVLFLFIYTSLDSLCYKSIFEKANIGDYSVYQNSSNVTLLSICDKTKTIIRLQEITAPRKIYNNVKGNDLQSWIAQNAPGHSSWTLMDIDIDSLEIISTYCVSRKIHLNLRKKDTIIASLLGLELKPMSEKEIPKIGPRGMNKIDTRKIWVPNMFIDGKKRTPKKVDIYSAIWKKDESVLSNRVIDLYILDNFAFPYWIQVHANLGNKKMIAIDSGKHLSPPKIHIPNPAPMFISGLNQSNTTDLYNFLLKSTPQNKDYIVYLMEISKENNKLFPVKSTFENIEGALLKFTIYKDSLEKKLEKGKKYRIYLSYRDSDKIKSIISKDTIHWK